MKRLYTLLTSASLLLAFAGGVLPQDFVQTVSAAEQAQDDAEKTGSIVLDEKTGTLTLSGNITAAEVQKYAKNEAVRAVVAAEGCVFPAYCSGMFKNFCAESIDISKADTSEVYSMDRMFVTCSNLKTVNLSGINTSDVEHMEGMFFACSNLTELDMSMLDTSNVRCMDNMFSHCENLTKLNLSGIDTAKVEDTTCMFWNCGLKELDLSGFHTPSLKNMYGMFTECGALKTLDLSGFDTSKVTDMQLCFDGCMMLEELDLSSFDTSNVQLMTQMFRSCRNLETIYCGEKWNLSSLEGKTKMFEDCKLLTGGNGTVYSDEHIDSEYARIDTADAPGYLTFKEKPTPQADWGNANCAEEVDVSDAVLVALYVAEDTGANLTAQGKINADVTHDGNITGDDTILILRYIAKMVTLADLEP